MFTISWNRCSRSTGTGVHDRLEHAATRYDHTASSFLGFAMLAFHSTVDQLCPRNLDTIPIVTGCSLSSVAEAIVRSLSARPPREHKVFHLLEAINRTAVGAKETSDGGKGRTSIKRTIRRQQLREMVPLADSTIYEMEQRGEFPRRFALSPRCVVWDLAEVEAWLAGAPIKPNRSRAISRRQATRDPARFEEPGRARAAASTAG